MTSLIVAGSLLTLAGLGVLLFTIRKAAQIRRSKSDDEANRAALKRLVATNFAGLALSAFGLIVVVVGLLLRP